MRKRLINAALALLFFVVTLVVPVKNLLSIGPAAGEREEGRIVASYVMLFLFGALTIVFLVRALRSSERPPSR